MTHLQLNWITLSAKHKQRSYNGADWSDTDWLERVIKNDPLLFLCPAKLNRCNFNNTDQIRGCEVVTFYFCYSFILPLMRFPPTKADSELKKYCCWNRGFFNLNEFNCRRLFHPPATLYYFPDELFSSRRTNNILFKYVFVFLLKPI
jgi:hypothetical protein